MATERQKRAVDELVGKGGNVTQAMLAAGYSPNTANTPQKLTESEGYRELMDAYLPDDMLLRALADDIEKKVGNRKPELELAFKVKGRMTEKVDVTTKGESLNNFNDEEKQSLLALLND